MERRIPALALAMASLLAAVLVLLPSGSALAQEPLEEVPHPRWTINVTSLMQQEGPVYCGGDIQFGFHGPLVEENVYCRVLD